MFKPRKLKPIKAGYDDQMVAFYPRTFSQAEQDEVDRQLAEADAETLDKYQRKFEIKRQAVADWSDSMPQEIYTEKGESRLRPIVKEQTNIADAIKTYFAERSVENERLIRAVYNSFVRLQNPDIDFL